MNQAINVDEDEHDLIRDEVLEELGEVEDDGVRVSRAYGHLTASLIVLSCVLSLESMKELLDHTAKTAIDLCKLSEESAA